MRPSLFLLVLAFGCDGSDKTGDSDPVGIPNTPPTVAIVSPADHSALVAGESVEVVVRVSDAEDAPGDLVLTWGGDAAGYGPPTAPDSSGEVRFYMTNLVEGDRTVRVTVTDPAGETDSEEILLQVATDGDGDGYNAAVDCDDADGAVHPDATEVCDGIDQDCDGITDDDATDAHDWYADADGDGWGDAGTITRACGLPAGHAERSGDCDDGAAAAYPGGAEVCDGLDNDCSGLVDESTAADAGSWYADTDGDGYGADATAVASCGAPDGYVAQRGDCDEGDADANPGATERCDGDDDDCDGTTDEADAVDAGTWYADVDGDGYGAVDTPAVACAAPGGYVADATDCDDAAAATFPGASETCEGTDQDCDGTVDDDPSDGTTFYADADGDGSGDASVTTNSCAAPAGTVANNDDCDDADATASPDAAELCDGVDNDCDAAVDEEPPTWYRDADGDGYGNASVTAVSCTEPTNYVPTGDDCDDGDPAQSPGGDEVCGNSVDDDCDGLTDDGTAIDATTFYVDADGDGYGDASTPTPACALPDGSVENADDCDDTDADTHPDTGERCDGADNDCDGTVDEGYNVPGDYASIEDAIAAASEGDVICVDAGDYAGPVDFGGKDVTVEGAGSGSTRIDVNGGRVEMDAGRLYGVTLWGGDDATGSALRCDTGPIALGDVSFEENACTAASMCYGVVYLYICDAELTDVVFRDNDISPATGGIYGGLIHGYYSGVASTGLVVEDNTIVAGDTLHGGIFYNWRADASFEDTTITGNVLGGTTVTGAIFLTAENTVDWDHLLVAENTVTATDLTGGVAFATTDGITNYTWASFLENSVTATTIEGGLFGGWYRSNPTFENALVAGNTVTATSTIYGGLFDLSVYPTYSSTYSVGTLLFVDVVGNDIAGGTVYGGVLGAEHRTSASSGASSGDRYVMTGWDLDMVNVVDTDVTGTTYGSVYYDNNATYSYNTDFDYCNIYDNTGTDFYNHTDPTGSSDNISVDPLYVDVSLANAVYWDLTLDAASPVRNAGNPSSTYRDPDGTYGAIGGYGGPLADEW